jgi:V/A-type H+-transporting ATPase subunit I
MIRAMARLRVMGLKEHLEETLDAIQDLGVMQLAPPCANPGCRPVDLSTDQASERTLLGRLVEELDAVVQLLRPHVRGRVYPNALERRGLLPWVERSRALRAELEGLHEQARALEAERVLLERYREVVRGFEPMLEKAAADSAVRAHYLVLRANTERADEALRGALQEALGDNFQLVSRSLPGGEVAVALLVPEASAATVDGLLSQAPLQDLPAPEAYGGGALMDALPRMLARLRALPDELARVSSAQRALADAQTAETLGALAAARDRLAELDALAEVADTGRAFVLEGWVPVDSVDRLSRNLETRFGTGLAVERVGVEEWARQRPPVVLRNPRIFRPFEAVTRLVPLPRYGTIDPTPFVAVSFPFLFGIILGDVGYGLVLAGLALLLRLRSRPDTTRRSAAAIAAACALFTVIFGFLYGELFGDLGYHVLGMRAWALSREEALFPALVLALGVGVVHILLGLVLGVVAAQRAAQGGGARTGRLAPGALGRGLAGVLKVLPRGLQALWWPLWWLFLAGVAEGLLAPFQFLATLAHILSYARIMAVGTASVLMAVVANRLAGAVGSVLVGVLFAVVFHVVNFALGVFAPAVHVLRLHYVEFFGEFYSPGGLPYRPLGRWRPDQHAAPS